MRRLLSYFSIASLLFACGEAGIGFNISKNLPVEIPVQFSLATDFPLPGINPPASPAVSDTYDLSSLGEDVNEIPEVIINELSFEIDGISSAEEVALDDISIDLILSNGNRINLAAGLTRLENRDLVVVLGNNDPRLDQLATTLFQDKELGFEIVFDFAEVPSNDLDFIYRLYFDVTAKVRVEN